MKRFYFLLGIMLLSATLAQATKGIVATDEDILRIKKDLQSGILKVDKTRLNQIRENYGDPSSINDTTKSVTYQYGDLRLVFGKSKIWKSWNYDSFKNPVYTDSADNLRFDLESKKLVGDNITYDQVESRYGVPTESEDTIEDGKMSVFYYGNIRMVFENIVVLSSWKGDLPIAGEAQQELISTPAPVKAGAATTTAAPAAPATGTTAPAATGGAPAPAQGAATK